MARLLSDAKAASRVRQPSSSAVNSNATLLSLPAAGAIESILARYTEIYPEERRLIRIRDVHGTIHRIDVGEADEPERPIIDSYSLIEERDLAPLLPEDLSEEDFVGFFRNSTSSWRPYAAGVPWFRDQACRKTLGRLLEEIDDVGPDENCIAYISSESGAGGTTLARALAWDYACKGYPVQSKWRAVLRAGGPGAGVTVGKEGNELPWVVAGRIMGRFEVFWLPATIPL
jgi:hypothetical protein